ncbi:MAG: ABC transporter ATP-binding protein [Chloroflexi bacterium]|nr:ABC transporter ATP-binding protein [Chloroflexota bacterium]
MTGSIVADTRGREAGAIVLRGLRKAYGPVPVVRDATLTVPAGQRVALLGANGSGKTTLLKVLATLLRPSGGTARIGGYDVVQEADAVRRLVGFLGHQTYLYDQLTPVENLTFYGRLYRVPDLRARVAATLEAVGLSPRRTALTGQLSHGQRQRLALARAILHDPAVLILDEPDAGLDLAGLEVLARVLCNGGRTVLFTTHNPDRALDLAQRSVVLIGGRLEDQERSPDATLAAYREHLGVAR